MSLHCQSEIKVLHMVKIINRLTFTEHREKVTHQELRVPMISYQHFSNSDVVLNMWVIWWSVVCSQNSAISQNPVIYFDMWML